MAARRIKMKPDSTVTPCPKCGNQEVFTIRSERCAEDCCEVWAECGCGYDPTAECTGGRLEDVWGSLTDENCLGALECWSEAIADSSSDLTPARPTE